MNDWSWINEVVLPLAVIVLGGGLVTTLIGRTENRREARRQGYGEAIAAVCAWREYAYQIRRRASDTPETFDRLVALGHDNQQRIARSLAWVATDNKTAFNQYRQLVDDVQAATGPHIKEAWNSPPITTAAGMNLNGWGPPSIDGLVTQFLRGLPRRRRL